MRYPSHGWRFPPAVSRLFLLHLKKGRQVLWREGAKHMSTTPLLTTPAAPRGVAFKPFELSARHQAAIAGCSDDDRALAPKALSVTLDYVKNALSRRASAERKLFDEALPIRAASTSW